MIDSILSYVRRDFEQNPLRAVCEIIGMSCGVGASIILALTTPIPLMFECYILWLIGSFLLLVCSLSRGSTGLALAYLSYFLIDVVGIIRTIVA
jgi:hypothetical protein